MNSERNEMNEQRSSRSSSSSSYCSENPILTSLEARQARPMWMSRLSTIPSTNFCYATKNYISQQLVVRRRAEKVYFLSNDDDTFVLHFIVCSLYCVYCVYFMWSHRVTTLKNGCWLWTSVLVKKVDHYDKSIFLLQWLTFLPLLHPACLQHH